MISLRRRFGRDLEMVRPMLTQRRMFPSQPKPRRRRRTLAKSDVSRATSWNTMHRTI